MLPAVGQVTTLCGRSLSGTPGNGLQVDAAASLREPAGRGGACSTSFHCDVSLFSASLDLRPHREVEQISLEGWGIKGNYTPEESPILCTKGVVSLPVGEKNPDRNRVLNEGHTLLQMSQKHALLLTSAAGTMLCVYQLVSFFSSWAHRLPCS